MGIIKIVCLVNLVLVNAQQVVISNVAVETDLYVNQLVNQITREK